MPTKIVIAMMFTAELTSTVTSKVTRTMIKSNMAKFKQGDACEEKSNSKEQ